MNQTLRNFFILTFLTFKMAYSQNQESLNAFQEKWKNSAEYLIAIAESIPESAYEFRPTERQMSVKEQLLHIRSNMLWLGSTYFNPSEEKIQESKNTPGDKEELIASLKRSFSIVEDLVAATEGPALSEEVEFFAGPKSRLQILNLLQDHVTHHRGQLIVYLNLLEITPPRYVGW